MWNSKLALWKYWQNDVGLLVVEDWVFWPDAWILLHDSAHVHDMVILEEVSANQSKTKFLPSTIFARFDPLTTFGYLKTEDWFEEPQIFRLCWQSVTCGNQHFLRKVWWMWGLNFTRGYQIEFKKLESFNVFKEKLKNFLLDHSCYTLNEFFSFD